MTWRLDWAWHLIQSSAEGHRHAVRRRQAVAEGRLQPRDRLGAPAHKAVSNLGRNTSKKLEAHFKLKAALTLRDLLALFDVFFPGVPPPAKFTEMQARAARHTNTPTPRLSVPLGTLRASDTCVWWRTQ